MSDPFHDVIVVGAGPAGLAAATECARTGLKCLVLDKLAPGGALINLGELHDVEEACAGTDMAARLTDEASATGVEIGYGEATRVGGGGPWIVETAEGEQHAARALVIATGLNKGHLGVPDEAAFEGRGLSHCAACDGPLYAGLPVVVAGSGGWADVEAHELRQLTGEVTIVSAAAGDAPAGIARIKGRIVALEGNGEGLASVVVDCGGQRRAVPARAVFVYVGQSPAAEFLPESLARDASGHIVVDEEGRTSAPLAFAVGDVRTGSRFRLAQAIADGRRAAKAIVAALDKN